jgi:hypothetical protein
MPSFLSWTKTVHQVAIAGKVVDPETSLGVAGATVTITAMPATFTKWLSLRALSYQDRWDKLAERPDRTVTAPDGFFRFIDLPDGTYTVTVSAKEGARRFGDTTQSFTVARDATGTIKAPIALIALPATGLRGMLVESTSNDDGTTSTTPISMACVEVSGTRERAYTDAAGGFYLTDLEPGVRTLTISASGYQTATVTATIVKGDVTEMGSFVITPVSASI